MHHSVERFVTPWLFFLKFSPVKKSQVTFLIEVIEVWRGEGPRPIFFTESPLRQGFPLDGFVQRMLRRKGGFLCLHFSWLTNRTGIL